MCSRSSTWRYSPGVSHGSLRRNPTPNPAFTSQNLYFFSYSTLRLLPVSHLRVVRSSLSFSWKQTKEGAYGDVEVDQASLLRRQNSCYSTFLLLHVQIEKDRVEFLHDKEDDEDLQREEIVEEICLATRRIPMFPGSVDFPMEDAPQALVEVDDRAFKRALDVRRGVAAEVLKALLGAGRLGKTYSVNVVSFLPSFVNQVVIEATEMKTFINTRAKVYIHGSGVVELVK